MQVIMYNSISDPRTVDKSLTQVAICDCEPFGEMDISNPVIRVKPFDGFANVNFFYIGDYLRYYSVKKCVRISGNILEIYGAVDVLMTYRDVIRQSKGVCVANEYVGSSYVPDKNLPVDIRKVLTVAEFSDSDFNQDSATELTHNFVINVAGGTAEEPEPEELEKILESRGNVTTKEGEKIGTSC